MNLTVPTTPTAFSAVRLPVDDFFFADLTTILSPAAVSARTS
jgi:hypothetical protein